MDHYDERAAHQRGHRRGPVDPRAGRDRRDIVHPAAQLTFDTSKPDGMPRKLLDVSKLHALGWRHRIGLKDGVASTYQWFLGSSVIAATFGRAGRLTWYPADEPKLMPSIPARVRSISLPPFDVLNTKAANLRAAGHDVITLGQGVPGFGPPAAAIDAARRALASPATHLYCADAGLSSLRSVLCDRLREHHGIDATADDVIVTAGGNQAFMLAATTLLDPGDEVILSTPYFVNHEMALRAIGAVPVEACVYEAQGFRTRWMDIEPHITSRTRAVVLCTPSNPTGAVIAADDLTKIVLELRARGIVVLCDETYMHFVYDAAVTDQARSAGRAGGANAAGAGILVSPSAAAIEGWRDNVVVLGTFSKSFGMTGWRLGYLLAGAAVCAQAIKIQDAMIDPRPGARTDRRGRGGTKQLVLRTHLPRRASETPPRARGRTCDDSRTPLESGRRRFLRVRSRRWMHRLARAVDRDSRRRRRGDDPGRHIRIERRRLLAAVVRRRRRTDAESGLWAAQGYFAARR